jgi:hypothetical protein
MPRKQKLPYTCPCCGYTTPQKSHMQKHLYMLLKPCPKQENVIDLTEEVKQHILNNRVYHIPKKTETQILIQQINNNQQINNFITRMDTFEKINKVIAKSNIELLPFDEQITQEYGDQISKFATIDANLVDVYMKTDNFIQLIDKLTLTDNIDTMNVVYHKTSNRLSIFESDEWETYPFDNGVRQLLDKIKLVFFDKYEEFLLDKLHLDDNLRERVTAKELLEEYYKFLVSFELRPFVFDEPRLLHYKDISVKIYDKVKHIKSTVNKHVCH